MAVTVTNVSEHFLCSMMTSHLISSSHISGEGSLTVAVSQMAKLRHGEVSEGGDRGQSHDLMLGPCS